MFRSTQAGAARADDVQLNQDDRVETGAAQADRFSASAGRNEAPIRPSALAAAMTMDASVS
jgi:hypothetical protein